MTYPIGQIIEDVPAEAYHASPGVSNSMLKHFARSPRHYQHALHAPKEPPTPAMELGTLFHLCVLEPEKFPLAFHVRPDDPKFYSSDGKFGSNKESKEWKATHADKTIITREQHANFLGARDAILADPMGELLMSLRSRNEVSLWVNHAETGRLLKSRYDRLAEDGDGRPMILDLKTTDDARRFKWQARDLRYTVQSTFYADNLRRAGIEDARFVFIVVEPEPPFGLRFVELDEDSTRDARETYEAELVQLAKCEKSGEWPGYEPTGIELIEIFQRKS